MLPATLLFSLILLTSIFLMMSSPSFLISWLALEMNAMAFIPIILSNNEMKSGEATVKYFLSQTMGSIWILMSSVMPPQFDLWHILLILGLALKLGSAPFHFWLPSMISHLPWSTTLILLTIQKINPLVMILTFNQKYSSLIIILATTSLFVGALGGLAQTQTRKILTYSSINQMGWLLISSLFSISLTLVFFTIYSIVLMPVILMFMATQFNLLKQNSSKNTTHFMLSMNMLSLGGLPPFLGFLGKWLVLSCCVNLLPYVSLLMILMSLVTLYFYLRLIINSLTLAITPVITMEEVSIPWTLSVFNQMSLGGLALSILII